MTVVVYQMILAYNFHTLQVLVQGRGKNDRSYERADAILRDFILFYLGILVLLHSDLNNDRTNNLKTLTVKKDRMNFVSLLLLSDVSLTPLSRPDLAC